MTKTNVPRLRFREFSGEWKMGHLSDIGTVKMNKRIHKKDTKMVGEVPFFKIGTFGKKPDAFIDRDKFIELKKRYPYPSKGDILISASGTLGRTVVYDGSDEYFQDSNIIWLDLNKKKMINSFLLQFYKQHVWNSEGTTIKRLYNKDIYNTEVNYPFINEQQKIGDFFAKQDKLIELQTQKVDQLKKLKRGYLQKMFPQEGETVPRLRFSGFSGEWKESKIEDIYSIGRGLVLSKKRISLNKTSGNIFPVYSSQTQNNGLLGYYSNYLYEDSITWTTDGANAGTVRFRSGKFYSTNVNGVLTNSNGYCNSMMANAIDRVAYKYVSHVGNPKLMNNTMKIIKIKYPSIIEQKKISSFINNIDHIIEEQSNKIGELKKQKKSYLQKMFV